MKTTRTIVTTATTITIIENLSFITCVLSRNYNSVLLNSFLCNLRPTDCIFFLFFQIKKISIQIPYVFLNLFVFYFFSKRKYIKTKTNIEYLTKTYLVLISREMQLICNINLISGLLKGALSSLRQFLANESPLYMRKNAFYFT